MKRIEVTIEAARGGLPEEVARWVESTLGFWPAGSETLIVVSDPDKQEHIYSTAAE